MAAAIVEADFLHRLYSTFANGWPGRGLLLLRVATFAFLCACLIQALTSAEGIWVSAIAAGLALLLLAGLWTPLVGVTIASIELWVASRIGSATAAHALAAAMALALSLLGPGAWSVDARLFGRRRISISSR